MAIEILLEGNLKPITNQENFLAFLQHFAHHQHVKFEDYGSIAIIEICPEGVIECSFENDFVSILAQTNVAGPGFHAYAAELLETLMQESEIEFEVSDPTGYMENHDFESLKYDYFYTWLTSIAEYVKENHEELENLCISWPMHYYRPSPKEGYVVTPMGYIAIDDFLYNEIEELAQRFFLWNEEGKQATYYLNCALNLIWKECYFEYSAMNEYTQKVATTIMDYLEIAYELDSTLPLPTHVYEVLANTLQREHLLTHAIAFDNQELGYRKNDIHYEFGNWILPLHGFSEIYQNQEKNSAQIIPAYQSEDEIGSWIVQMNIQEKGDYEPVFVESNEFVMDRKELDKPFCNGKMVTIDFHEYYEVFAQIMSEKEQIILRFQSVDKASLAIGTKLIEGIHHVHISEEETVKH